jgi:hypothetical protein
MSPLAQAPFLPAAREEGERYFREFRSAIPGSNWSTFAPRVVENKATVASPVNGAIAADYRVNFAQFGRLVWMNSLL